jgi:hypothetical protein
MIRQYFLSIRVLSWLLRELLFDSRASASTKGNPDALMLLEKTERRLDLAKRAGKDAAPVQHSWRPGENLGADKDGRQICPIPRASDSRNTDHDDNGIALGRTSTSRLAQRSDSRMSQCWQASAQPQSPNITSLAAGSAAAPKAKHGEHRPAKRSSRQREPHRRHAERDRDARSSHRLPGCPPHSGHHAMQRRDQAPACGRASRKR